MATHLDLIFIRHGEPDIPKGTFLGRTDPPLDANGRLQAETVAETVAEILGHKHIAKLLVSPLLRARQSAEPVTTCFGLQPQFDERLQEIDFGSWDGRTHSQILSDDPDGVQPWFDDPAHVRPGGGETFQDVRNRVAPLLAELAAEELDGCVILVSHFGVIANAAAIALDLPVTRADRLRLGRGQAGRIHKGTLCWWGLPAMPPADRRIFGSVRH